MLQVFINLLYFRLSGFDSKFLFMSTRAYYESGPRFAFFLQFASLSVDLLNFGPSTVLQSEIVFTVYWPTFAFDDGERY